MQIASNASSQRPPLFSPTVNKREEKSSQTKTITSQPAVTHYTLAPFFRPHYCLSSCCLHSHSRPRTRQIHPRPQAHHHIIPTPHNIPRHPTQPIRARPNIRKLCGADASAVAAARTHTASVAGRAVHGRRTSAEALRGGEVEVREACGFAEGVAVGWVLACDRRREKSRGVCKWRRGRGGRLDLRTRHKRKVVERRNKRRECPRARTVRDAFAASRARATASSAAAGSHWWCKVCG